MPPASKGFIRSPIRNVFQLHALRATRCQRRLTTQTPAKPATLPKLPPAHLVKAAVAKELAAKQSLAAREAEERDLRLKQEQERNRPTWTQRAVSKIPIPGFIRRLFQWLTGLIHKLFARLSLPPAAQRGFRRLTPPWLRTWIYRLFLIGPPVAVLLRSFPLDICNVQGPSMAPFLNVHSAVDDPMLSHDSVIIQKVHNFKPLAMLFGLSDKKTLERGQVIVFYAPHNPEKMAVKRIVGLPGDRITPLPGYPGGDEAVVIPYNHLWVEGDAGDRKKSVDSNHFGPISQNMVYGFVLGVWSSWLTWPVSMNWQEQSYPAKHSGRVEKDVVHTAKLHPDDEERLGSEAFTNGTAAFELAMMKSHPERIPRLMRDQKVLGKCRTMYAQALREVERADVKTKDVAVGLVEQLEVAFESVGLSKDGSRMGFANQGLGPSRS